MTIIEKNKNTRSTAFFLGQPW